MATHSSILDWEIPWTEEPSKLQPRTHTHIIQLYRRQQKTRWLDGITDSMDMTLSKLQEVLKDSKAWRTTVHGGCQESDTIEQYRDFFKKSLKFYRKTSRCLNKWRGILKR